MYPTHHRQITRTALIYWQRESGVALPDALCQAIVRGSGIEDAPSWQRLYHWHFYRSNPQIPDWPLLRLTSEYRVRALQQHLSRTQPHVERGEWIGRLLHHLQDMSTPAHVVPIYHDPLFADGYEKRLPHLLPPDWASPQPEVTLDATAVIAETGELGLYHYAAQQTLAWLDSHDSTLAATLDDQPYALTSTQFWQPPSIHDSIFRCGFGRRGPLYRAFGLPMIPLAGKLLRVSDAEYRRFFRTLFRKSLCDSLTLLRWSLNALREAD